MKSSKDENKNDGGACKLDYSSQNSNTMQWLMGLILASIFSLVYIITPTYFILAFLCAIFQFPSKNAALIFSSPILISALLTKPVHGSPRLFLFLRPILSYFSYEEILECSTEKLFQSDRPYIIATQPHGVVRNYPRT
jgi:hypothetical protein